ncbi:MAG: TonB-dependent receptor [Bacteroidota bacterium]
MPTTLYTLKGIVKDRKGELKIDAHVLLTRANKLVNTDKDGVFTLSALPGEYDLIVRYLGMKTVTYKVHLYAAAFISVVMDEDTEMLNEIIVLSEAVDKNVKGSITGVNKLNIADIKKIPPFLGEADVIKSLQLLPGVSSVGEGANGFNVRGGRTDQNLVMMNGGQMFNTSHLLGFFSAFNPDVTENVVLYKGNVPAQYGGRISSVLDVQNRNGDFEKYHMKAGIGIASGRVAVDGPIAKGKSSFIVGSRFSYSSWLLGLVNNADVKNSNASFYDFNAGITQKIGSKHVASLSYYKSNDYFRFSQQFGYRYGTDLGVLQVKSSLGPNVTSQLSASMGHYTSSYFDPSDAVGINISNGLHYAQVKENFGITPFEDHDLNAGFEINHYSSDPEKVSPVGDNSGVIPRQNERDTGREFSLYASDEFPVTDRLSFTAGLRYTFYQNVGAATVYQYSDPSNRTFNTIIDSTYYSKGKVIQNYGGLEPRFSGRISLSDKSSIKFGYNRMRQYINLISNTTSPTPVDLWQVSNNYVPPQVGDNFSLGIFKNFSENKWETSIEGFYRKSKDLVEYKNFAELLNTNHLETELVRAAGQSYGVELFIRKVYGPWTGWLSYTYSRSFVKAPIGEKNSVVRYPSNYDKPHNITLSMVRKFATQSSFSFNYIFTSGRPMTAIATNYLSGSSVTPVFSERNQQRIPYYMRIDLSLTVGSVFRKVNDDLTFSIYNILARKNAYSVFYQRPGSRPLPEPYKLAMIGTAVPSITYNITF